MEELRLSLCGDVMTGRGIDQVMPHPGNPELRESCVTSSLGYVELAEIRNGPISRPVDFGYIWGDALAEFARADMRIANLEAGITKSCEYWPKNVHYKMNPGNAGCLSLAGIDCCALANNHMLDFGYAGLSETLEVLERNALPFAGAGRDDAQARAPVIKEIGGAERVVVFSYGSTTSGIPADWAAAPDKPGVNLLRDFSQDTVARLQRQVYAIKRAGDVVVASIHWGANFGYGVPEEETLFAHSLIENAGVDVVHGHSSHHPKAIEVFAGKLILYGCGDFINDYEGIAGYEAFRDDLVLLYLPAIRIAAGTLARLTMIPFRIARFRLNRAAWDDASWLCDMLNREGTAFGTRFALTEDAAIELLA